MRLEDFLYDIRYDCKEDDRSDNKRGAFRTVFFSFFRSCINYFTACILILRALRPTELVTD